MRMPNRRNVLVGGTSVLAASCAAGAAQAQDADRKPGPVGRLTSFRPGAVWLDTAGKPIQAHGGSMIKLGDTFYWYGENKEHTDGRGGAKGIWHWGVRMYSSQDLYNWDDLGIVIPPQPNDPSSPLYPSKGMDRPHIVFNAATKKFVCWIKIMETRGKDQTRVVLVADKIIGPYTMVRQGLHPLGMNAGDFDIAVAAEDGKAYMYFDRVHSEVICADLTDDYTDFTGYYSTHFPHPPLSREGPAYFRRNGKHYLATSGISGYLPNPSEIAIADTYHGPFEVLGDLHPKDPTHTSFDSQISCIFKHPDKKDLYIAMADRWTAAVPTDVVNRAAAVTARLHQPERPALTEEDIAALKATDMNSLNTSAATYVWLPVQFDGDRPIIDWRDEWSLDEFA